MIDKIKRLHGILNGSIEPLPADKSFKCTYCSFECDKRQANPRILVKQKEGSAFLAKDKEPLSRIIKRLFSRT